ncbi:MAG: hypothetical protein K2L96_08905, partial [Muribaculaceae bacterium]|nr:hypothetical protein [Muribaculaceae bacterium]
IKDNFTMAEFNINGRMTVSSLRKQFKDAFGATLRVYKGAKFAPENATLASIRSGENVKGGELTCKGNLQVGNFEAKMKDIFGITVKVANSDNTKLMPGNMTIAAAGREAVETDNLTDEQLQLYFWNALQDQLIAKGYDIEKKDFTADVADYAKSTRYKRYGVTFDIYKTKDRKNKAVTFSIIMKERYFYGVRYKGEVATGPALVSALTGVDPLINVDVDHSAWAACATASPRNELNFKTMKSEGFGKLKNPSARAAFMGGIANEIDTLIKKMVKSFKDKGL